MAPETEWDSVRPMRRSRLSGPVAARSVTAVWASDAKCRKKVLTKTHVHTFAEVTPTPEADVEDMFDPEFYLAPFSSGVTDGRVSDEVGVETGASCSAALPRDHENGAVTYGELTVRTYCQSGCPGARRGAPW
jgi:hypothetical protein